MSSQNLVRRLERLEAERAPAEEDVLPFIVTDMSDDGTPMKTTISEMRFPRVPDRRRTWSRYRRSAQR
jgi:hypothetical protein